MARRPSWKKALGVTKFKRKVASVTGIPTTKSGRKRKAKRAVASLTGISTTKSARRQAGKGGPQKTAGCATILIAVILFAVAGVILAV